VNKKMKDENSDAQIALDQFLQGERDLFCIGAAATSSANILGSLTFRKAADNKRQIVAWSRSEEAERWMLENEVQASKVVRLTIAELRSMPLEWRRYYSLEVVG
jgi:hypothetical protein